MPKSEQANAILAWSKNIPKFVKDVFDVDPTTQQKAYLNDVCEMVWAKIKVYKWNATGKLIDGKPVTERELSLNAKFGTSVMSGVGTGKGATASWIIIWFLTVFPFPKIAVTSPSAKQLQITLWAELAKWHQRSKLKDWFTWQTDKFFFNEAKGQQWFAVTRTANTKNSAEEQAETLAGLHEDYLLIIGDEASGIPDPVFRPLESTLTRMCNLCLLFFNPTRAKGFAIDTHNRDRENWLSYRWNAEESEVVTKDSVERLAKKYGRDSNTFRIRVLGLPPLSGENTVIPWEWIIDAVDRELEVVIDDPTIYSLDVGAGGDESCLLHRTGPLVHPLKVAGYSESNALIEWVSREVLADDPPPKALLLDSIGVGWGIEGPLRKRFEAQHIDVYGINVANTAFNAHRFHRLRDELWWRCRGEFEKGFLSIPDDPLLMGDLNAPRYEEVTGKIKIETKKDMKKRGVESPNRADSLIQTTYWGPEIARKMFARDSKRKAKRKAHRSWKVA